MRLFHAYYGFIPIITIICIVAFFTLFFSLLSSKKSFKVKDIIFVIILFFGIYLSVPFSLMYLGRFQDNPKMYKLALKLSIFPYDKTEIYYQLASMYDGNSKHLNGKLAIEYYEKTIKGNYIKNKRITSSLLKLYLFKGDYDKVAEIESKANTYDKLELTLAYIMQGKYHDALKIYNIDYVDGLFLKADLYKLTGQTKEAEKQLKIAIDVQSSKKLPEGRIPRITSVRYLKETMKRAKNMYKF